MSSSEHACIRNTPSVHYLRSIRNIWLSQEHTGSHKFLLCVSCCSQLFLCLHAATSISIIFFDSHPRPPRASFPSHRVRRLDTYYCRRCRTNAGVSSTETARFRGNVRSFSESSSLCEMFQRLCLMCEHSQAQPRTRGMRLPTMVTLFSRARWIVVCYFRPCLPRVVAEMVFYD